MSQSTGTFEGSRLMDAPSSKNPEGHLSPLPSSSPINTPPSPSYLLLKFPLQHHCLAFPRLEVWSEMKSLSRVQFFVTPWTVAYQAPLSVEFSKQVYWSGLPFWPLNPHVFMMPQKPLPIWFLLWHSYTVWEKMSSITRNVWFNDSVVCYYERFLTFHTGSKSSFQ